jgi:hypothetical protein
MRYDDSNVVVLVAKLKDELRKGVPVDSARSVAFAIGSLLIKEAYWRGRADERQKGQQSLELK